MEEEVEERRDWRRRGGKAMDEGLGKRSLALTEHDREFEFDKRSWETQGLWRRRSKRAGGEW